MSTKRSSSVKNTIAAITFSALAFSTSGAFASTLESAEYGNTAWDWWENASSQTEAASSQLNTDYIAYPETRSSEFGSVPFNAWNTSTNADVTLSSSDSFREVSPELGHFPINWYQS